MRPIQNQHTPKKNLVGVRMFLVLPSTGGGFGRSRTCCGTKRDWQSPSRLGRHSDLRCPTMAFTSLSYDSCPPSACCDTSPSPSSVSLPQRFEALYKVVTDQRAAPLNGLTSAVSDSWVHQTVLQVHVVSSGDPLGTFLCCPHTVFCCCHFMLDFHFGRPCCHWWVALSRALRLPQDHHRVLGGKGQQGPLGAGLCFALVWGCAGPLGGLLGQVHRPRSFFIVFMSITAPASDIPPRRHLPPPQRCEGFSAAFGVGGGLHLSFDFV